MKANLKNSTWDLGAKKARQNAEIWVTDNADKMRRGGATGELQFVAPEYVNEDKSLVLLQVNCRSIYNKVWWPLSYPDNYASKDRYKIITIK
jgi:hypothetical protein